MQIPLLVVCPNLQTLNLQANSIDDDGAKALANCLSPFLQMLILNSNNIGDEGLKHSPYLQTLDLKSNMISKGPSLMLWKIVLTC